MLRHESSNNDGTHVSFDEAQTPVASFRRVAPNNLDLWISVYVGEEIGCAVWWMRHHYFDFVLLCL